MCAYSAGEPARALSAYERRAVLLVLDDLHQADAATVQLVHYLARHASDARLLVVATVHAGEGESVLAALACPPGATRS